MIRILLTNRITRNVEMRSWPSGKSVINFNVATNDYRGGEQRTEYHAIVTWERLAEICGQYLTKGQLVALEGRLQTRSWEDDRKIKHWRTEIVAAKVKLKVYLVRVLGSVTARGRTLGHSDGVRHVLPRMILDTFEPSQVGRGHRQ
jgi:single-strand DNA-binding protein